ncbi:hypothetical protein K9N50_08340 [bacterium]|nr:hypothetical protein [bacterium]
MDYLIADYNFTGALKKLDELNGDFTDDKRASQLRALALLVEGRTDEGFVELAKMNGDEQGYVKEQEARILLRAAEVIAREKDRYNEVITLLDSSIYYDPSIKEEALELAWVRAIEYLDVPGVGGFYLIEFINKYDSAAPLKLQRRSETITRVYNYTGQRIKQERLVYSQRYEEMKRMSDNLQLIGSAVERYNRVWKRLPQDIYELKNSGQLGSISVNQKGWRLELLILSGNRYKINATALKDNPGGVLIGTVMSFPQI